MADSKVEMDYEHGKAIITKTVIDENGTPREITEEVALPKVEFGQGTIRKTLIGEDGKTYEVEETIHVPIFGKRETEGEKQ